jgi:hypothetical protein
MSALVAKRYAALAANLRAPLPACDGACRSCLRKIPARQVVCADQRCDDGWWSIVPSRVGTLWR